MIYYLILLFISHLNNFYIYQTLLSKATYSGYTFVFVSMCSLGIEPTSFCAANAILYHSATGTRYLFQVVAKTNVLIFIIKCSMFYPLICNPYYFSFISLMQA